MLKQRVADIDFRQEVRGKLNRAEQANQEYGDQISKHKAKIDQLQMEIKDY